MNILMNYGTNLEILKKQSINLEIQVLKPLHAHYTHKQKKVNLI